MSVIDLPDEVPPPESALSLSKGVVPWVDDLIAGTGLVFLVSMVAPRIYRWFSSQPGTPRDWMEGMLHHSKGAAADLGDPQDPSHGVDGAIDLREAEPVEAPVDSTTRG